MAHVELTHRPQFLKTVFSAIAMPFQAISSVFDSLNRVHVQIAEIDKLNATSDEALAARGVTREDELNRIFDI